MDNYTTHGWHIPGTNELPLDKRPSYRARCGGVRHCLECRKEVKAYYDLEKKERLVDVLKHDGEELTGKDAENILKIVYECMYQSGSIMYPEELQDRLNDAGYGMKKPEIRPHYRK